MERLSRQNKLNILCSHLKITPDFGCRPYQTLKEMFTVRNGVAHGKPAHLVPEVTIETGHIEEIRRRMPLTEWEERCTIEFAEQAYADVGKIAKEIWSAAGFDNGDLWSRGDLYSLERLDDQ